MINNIALIVAVVIGFSIAFQPVTNAMATRQIGLASLMVVSNGLVLLGSIAYAVLVRERLNFGVIATLRPDLLLGGALYGLIILFGGIYAFPRLGVTLALMIIVLSQLVFGLVIDHYGLYGVPRQPLSWVRLFGVGLVVMGLVLVRFQKG